jgi:hypothetical protein
MMAAQNLDGFRMDLAVSIAGCAAGGASEVSAVSSDWSAVNQSMARRHRPGITTESSRSGSWHHAQTVGIPLLVVHEVRQPGWASQQDGCQ